MLCFRAWHSKMLQDSCPLVGGGWHLDVTDEYERPAAVFTGHVSQVDVRRLQFGTSAVYAYHTLTCWTYKELQSKFFLQATGVMWQDAQPSFNLSSTQTSSLEMC